MGRNIKIGGLLLLSSYAAVAGNNLVQNGQFELDIIPAWQAEDANVAVVYDAERQSNVLHISNKKFAYSTASYVLEQVIPGYTYYIGSAVKSGDGSLGFVVTYRGDELNNLGEPKDSIIVVGEKESNGEWVNYQGYFTLPTDFDTEFPVKIKPKTGVGNLSDIYIDDISLVEVGINSSIQDAESFESVFESYWTATSINGKRLDVMRATWADTLGTAELSPSHLVSFGDLDTFFAGNTQYGWRYGTLDEMKAIADFYYQDEFAVESQGFLELNDAVWSPKGDVNVWNMAIPGVVYADHGTDVQGETSWMFTVKEGLAISNVKHDHSINPSKTSSAALIVRESLELIGGAELVVEATGLVTDITDLGLDLPLAIGGATPGVVTPSVDISSLVLGRYDIEWQVDDIELNSLTHNQVITVVDTTAPEFPPLIRETRHLVGEGTVELILESVSTIDLVDGELLASHELAPSLPMGCYRINWQSSDASGNISIATQKLQIIDDVECPLAFISGDKEVLERQEITLDGGLSSVDVTKAITYSWSLISGEGLSVSGSDASITFSAPSLDADGLYQVQLEVSDGDKTDYSIFQFKVIADPELVSPPPIIVVEVPSLANELSSLSLDASASVVDESLAAQYTWRVVSGPELVFEPSGDTTVALLPDVPYDSELVLELLVDDGISQVTKQWGILIQDTTPKVSLIEDQNRNEQSAAGGVNWHLLWLFLMVFAYRQPLNKNNRKV